VKYKTSILASILLCLVNVSFANAPKIIRGYIKNADTDEVLPIANIQVEGTLRGTISNENGEYILELKQLPATVLVRYIGFESKRITITENSPNEQNVLLKPILFKLETIVVRAEDPGVTIMREVIKRKQEWRKRARTYKAEAYTRLALENDTSIAFISESVSEVFWDREKGGREVIKSKRETSNIRSVQILASASHLPNFYDDDIEIQGNRVIGPTHPRALRFYDFKLEGQRARDDKIVFDISVTPKSKLQPTFTGRVSVLDEDYAMIEVDLKPSEAVLMPFPIQDWNVFHKQQFSNFGQAFWLPVDVRIVGDIKIGMTGLQFPIIKYNQLSHLTNYQINVLLPDSLYKKKKVVSVDSLSVKQDTLFSSKSHVIPLTVRETEAYATIDSTMTLEKAFQPTGFLARFAKLRVSTGDEDEKSKKGDKSSFLTGFSPQIRHNRVDAYHLGLKYKKMLHKRLTISMRGAYKTGLKRWSYGGGFRCHFRNRSNTFIAVNYLADTDSRYHSDSYPLLFNSILTLLGYDDYFDYYWNERIVLEIGHRINRINTQLSVGLHNEDHTSVSKTTDSNLLGRSHVQRINPAIQEGRLRSVVLGVRTGDEYTPWGVVGQRRAQLRLEHSSPDLLSSDFSFTRYELKIDWRMGTFLRRRLTPNVLDVCVVAGTSRGDLPLQRFASIDARLGAFSPFGVFKSLRERPYEGERYFALFWEHNFRTVPFEILGMRTLAKKGIGIILHGAVGRTWISDKRGSKSSYELQYIDDFHHEIGLSLNSLFGIFRLDATRRLDKPGFFIGFSMARIF
jgi:hypothetical protein